MFGSEMCQWILLSSKQTIQHQCLGHTKLCSGCMGSTPEFQQVGAQTGCQTFQDKIGQQPKSKSFLSVTLRGGWSVLGMLLCRTSA